MYTCELCGKEVKDGYMVIDMKLTKPYVVCYECGKPIRVDKEKE